MICLIFVKGYTGSFGKKLPILSFSRTEIPSLTGVSGPTARSTGYIGVLSIYGFFLVATLVNKVMMTPIVTYVVRQEEKEGTFR